jgi:predicted tellurium resistance membrane protein TerC
MEWMASPEAWVALATLTALEIVLGIDNIVFISILTGRLPQDERPRARQLGLLLAMGMRIVLLFFINWITQLTKPLFDVLSFEISGRDLILIGGGLFLIGKATLEIHHKLEGEDEEGGAGAGKAATFAGVLVQVALLDVVFSLDSVITAVGMAEHLEVMILAVVIAVITMVAFVNSVSRFIERHPTFKMLAMSFLLLIGFALVGEGLELHIPKGYVYSAMGFSLFVEVLNLQLRKRTRPPVALRGIPRASDPED